MKQILLPSGKIATYKKGYGQNLLNAQRKARTNEEIMYSIMAEVIEIDGQPLIYEDIFEMELEDVVVLYSEISGKFTPLLQSASFTSVKQPDGN